jgi:acyl-CoA dehydrogenase
MSLNDPKLAAQIAARVENFVRTEIVPYEKDPRNSDHGPTEELVHEMRAKAAIAGVLTPHILDDGSHFNQRGTATIFKKSGLSILGPTPWHQTKVICICWAKLPAKVKSNAFWNP